MALKRKSSNGASHRPGVWGDHSGQESALHGVEIQFVCGRIPVLTLDTASLFHEHVSEMLQSALSSGDKADSLYAYCEDRDIRLDCRRTGFRDDDLMAARLKQEGFQWVRAVGTTGKRSLMLALVVALAIEKEDLLDELWALLRSYHIHTHFAEVLHCSKEALSMVNFSRQSPAPKDTMNSLSRGLRPALADCAAAADPEVPEDSHGVDLQFVGNGVPVLGLDKTSVFQGCASWLLQTATGSDGKADGLFEYFNARELVSACCSLGLTKDDVFLARLKRAGLQEVQAVGTTGKRSVMLALVVALVLQERVQAESMMKTVRGFDRALEEPFLSLVRRALRHGSAPAGRPPAKRPKCVIEDSPGPEELRARGQRAQRFEAAGRCRRQPRWRRSRSKAPARSWRGPTSASRGC